MEPLTTATSFATIVGLLSNFLGHRSQEDSSELQDFLAWLRTHGHDEVIAAIESSQATSISIKAALSEGQKKLTQQLDSIERHLAALAEPYGPLGAISSALSSPEMLSHQAKNMLMAFE